MPYYKCTQCHHEFEGAGASTLCDWCGAPSTVLEKETPLEKMCKPKTIKKLLSYLFQPKGYKDVSWFEIIRCRSNSHKCGVIWYDSDKLEPNMTCRNCGDELG